MCPYAYSPLRITSSHYVLTDRRGMVVKRDGSGLPRRFDSWLEADQFCRTGFNLNIGEEGDRAND
jgi:hypothetical protein